MSSKVTWLVVGNGMNWGKGRTFLAAFINCMNHDSRTYPTSKLWVRKLTPPTSWETEEHPEGGRMKTFADFHAAVRVDEMGNGEWPKDAVVQKIDLGKGESLAAELEPVFKKWRDFSEEVQELMCTEPMDETFGGDANELEV